MYYIDKTMYVLHLYYPSKFYKVCSLTLDVLHDYVRFTVKQRKVSSSRVVITAEDNKKATSARQHAATYRKRRKASEQRRPTGLGSPPPHTIASDSHNLFSDLHFEGNLSRH